MSAYSVVLNLSGNAVERTERLAASLSTAAANAAVLAMRLSEVAAASRLIPAKPIRVSQRYGSSTAPPSSSILQKTGTRIPSAFYGRTYNEVRSKIRDNQKQNLVTQNIGSSVATSNLVRANQQASLSLATFSGAVRNAVSASQLNAQADRTAATAVKKLSVAAETLAAATKTLASITKTLSAAQRTNTVVTQANTNAKRAETVATPNYTRHKNSHIAAYGTGFNFGPFSGRLSTILQPDENGMLLGMDAGKLMKAANIGAISAEIAKKAGEVVLKTIAYSTAAPLVIGGGSLMLGLRALESEGFAEGARLISRQHQARLGLGEGYEQAQRNTDMLAASWGLDRSTSLSNVNTLTGLKIGGTGQELNLSDATFVTKVAGLISQHHSVPFERVATNMQQLLVQVNPSLRDIREMLNQAPILGKYALREMKEKGLDGDMREYLKDQKNLMSVWKQYEMDIATNAGMQARGQIAVAKQNAWANIAGVDDWWRLIGDEGAKTIEAMAEAGAKFLTMLAGSDEFNVMLKNLTNAFENLGTYGVPAIEKFLKAVGGVTTLLGIDVGDKKKAIEEKDIDKAIDNLKENHDAFLSFKNIAIESGQLKTDPKNKVTFEKEVWSLYYKFIRDLRNDSNFRSNDIVGIGEFKRLSGESLYKKFPLPPSIATAIPTAMQEEVKRGIHRENGEAFLHAADTIATLDKNKHYISLTKFPQNSAGLIEPNASYAAQTIEQSKVNQKALNFFEDMRKILPSDLSAFSNIAGSEAGDELRGMNRDRRSLEIHFHSPLVEWDNTIMSGDPQTVTNDIADNLESMVSVAIQRALLGASNRAQNRF